MSSTPFDVTFLLPGGRQKTGSAVPGDKITQVAYKLGIHIKQTCGGTPSCTDCRVIIASGGKDCVEDMEDAERALLGNVFHITGERLACQCQLKSAATIEVTPLKED